MEDAISHFLGHRGWGLDPGHAHQEFPGDQGGKLGFAHLLGTRRACGKIPTCMFYDRIYNIIMNMNELRAFIAVAETGSVSRAASRLHLTQPALTRRIQNLEAHLRTSLLDRSTKPPTLTATGRRVLDNGRRVLRALAELEASCRPDGEASGPLRLGVAHGLAESVLVEPLDSVRLVFPKLDLFVRTGWTKEMSKDLENGSLEGLIGLLPTERSEGSFATETLGQEEVVVVAPSQWVEPDPCTISDLSEASWVLNPAGCSYRSVLENAFGQRGVPMRIVMEVLGRELQLSLVARGVGLSLCPLRALRASRKASELRVLKIPDLKIRVDIALMRGPGTSDLSAVFAKLAEGIGRTLRADTQEA